MGGWRTSCARSCRDPRGCRRSVVGVPFVRPPLITCAHQDISCACSCAPAAAPCRVLACVDLSLYSDVCAYWTGRHANQGGARARVARVWRLGQVVMLFLVHQKLCCRALKHRPAARRPIHLDCLSVVCVGVWVCSCRVCVRAAWVCGGARDPLSRGTARMRLSFPSAVSTVASHRTLLPAWFSGVCTVG